MENSKIHNEHTHQDNELDKNVQFYSDEDTRKTFSYWAKIYAASADYRKKLIMCT